MTMHQDWTADAACRGLDTELFYPVADTARLAAPAKAICADCPVRADCLAWALEIGDDHAVLGGLTPRERRALRRAGRRAA